MVRPLRVQYPGAYYHVTCRGNERARIYLDHGDREMFLAKLIRSREIYNVSLLGYVCMPNHFHLLLTTPAGNLSEFMRHFNISYTAAFNRRHRRVGHLYQGRYKAFLINADSYLLAVSRYIHLNPVRTTAYSGKPVREKWERLLEYKWSSLPGYISTGKRRGFINYDNVLNRMGGDNPRGREDYRRFVVRGLEGDVENPLELGKGHGIVGEEDFIETIREKFMVSRSSLREQPALKLLKKEVEPSRLIEDFSRMVGKSRDEVCRWGQRSPERAMLMELLYRYCHIPQPEIGQLVGGIDYSAVSQARKRFRARLEKDPELKEKFEEISARLLQSPTPSVKGKDLTL